MSIIYDFKTVNQSAKDISSHTFDWMENRSHADDANGGFGAPGPPPRKRSRGSASVDPHPSVPTPRPVGFHPHHAEAGLAQVTSSVRTLHG